MKTSSTASESALELNSRLLALKFFGVRAGRYHGQPVGDDAMANPKHIAKLREGVEAWNKWRLNRSKNVDLSNADLQTVNLPGADLFRASLHGADLRGADLRGADLS